MCQVHLCSNALVVNLCVTFYLAFFFLFFFSRFVSVTSYLAFFFLFFFSRFVSVTSYLAFFFQAAAVSMCQYLASEVHSPHTETSQATAKEAEESNDTKKKLPPTKKVSKPFPSPGTQPKAPTAVAPAKLPPPSPVVSQLMEMGFDRRYIEYAIQTTKSTSPQRLINWLIEHQDIEIPEASLVPPAPVHPPDTPPTSEPQASGRKHEETESSSDSEDSDVGDAEDTEGDGSKEVAHMCK